MNKFKIIIIAFLSHLLGVTLGQTSYSKNDCILHSDSISNRKVYQSVDTMPEFPGGNDAMNQFILDNLIWPKWDADFTGTVVIEVIVEPDGTLTNMKVIRSIFIHADEEALRIIKKMPSWNVGKCKGIPVPVMQYIEIKFTIN